MATTRDFNERYKMNDTPWELGRPDNNLIHYICNWPIPPGKALEIGCGTGHNSIWLAENGFNTFGIDLCEDAISKAKARPNTTPCKVRFDTLNFLEANLEDAPFSFAFDRGCFHTMNSADDREKFASLVAHHLGAKGLWLSFIGSDDAPPREGGPPRLTASQIVEAVEPHFEILLLKAGVFDSIRENPAKSWQCLMKKRDRGT